MIMSRNELGVKIIDYSVYVFLRAGIGLLSISLYYWLGRDEVLLPIILGLGAILIAIPIVGFIGMMIKVSES